MKYNIKPWVRLGLNLEYDMLRSTDKGMLSTTTNRDYEIKDPSTGKTYPTTLETKMDRFQNRYTMQYAMADLNVDFNIMEFWHNRKAQQLNLGWESVSVICVDGAATPLPSLAEKWLLPRMKDTTTSTPTTT